MLYNDRTDLVKSNSSKECMACPYCSFNYGFNFRVSACNVCYDLKMLSINISDITISTVKNFDYRCIIHNSES